VTIASALAGFVLDASGLPIAQATRELVTASGDDAGIVADAVDGVITDLLDAGLFVARTQTGGPVAPQATVPPVPAPLVERAGSTLSASLPIFADHLAFRSTSADLLAKIEDWLALRASDSPPTWVFNVERTGTGGVLLEAAEDWEFPTLRAFE